MGRRLCVASVFLVKKNISSLRVSRKFLGFADRSIIRCARTLAGARDDLQRDNTPLLSFVDSLAFDYQVARKMSVEDSRAAKVTFASEHAETKSCEDVRRD